jgi:hypothetical protein
VVKEYAAKLGVTGLAPHDSAPVMREAVPLGRRRTGPDSFLLGHISVQTTERSIGCKQRISGAVNDHIGIEP